MRCGEQVGDGSVEHYREVTKAGEEGTCLWLNMGLPLGL